MTDGIKWSFPRVIRLRGKIKALVFDVNRMLDEDMCSFEIKKYIKSKMREFDKFEKASYIKVYER